MDEYDYEYICDMHERFQNFRKQLHQRGDALTAEALAQESDEDYIRLMAKAEAYEDIERLFADIVGL